MTLADIPLFIGVITINIAVWLWAFTPDESKRKKTVILVPVAYNSMSRQEFEKFCADLKEADTSRTYIVFKYNPAHPFPSIYIVY